MVDRRRFSICRSGNGGVAGSRPGRRPHFLYGQEMGERSRRGLCPLDLRAASGWPSAKVGGAPTTDEWTGVPQPVSRRAAGAMPLPESLRNRTGSASGETRVAHHAHVRSAAHGRRSFLAGLLFPCWERPQPELSPQLAYSWGAVVTGGYWQGTPGGFSRGLAEVPLSVLLWVLSLTQRKYPARRGGTRQSPPPKAAHSERLYEARKSPPPHWAENLRKAPESSRSRGLFT